jgi:hypothetical protein|tara:strand:- start:1320 stop:1502 length:183 start_codon:yes stop_codon:yes gene_type:complete
MKIKPNLNKRMTKKEPSHAEIIAYIEDEGWGGKAIQSDGNPTPKAYAEAKKELKECNKGR